MKIENIERCKALLDSRDKLIQASEMLEAKSARVVIMTTDGPLDLGCIPEPDLTYSVQDALDTRVKKIEEQLSNL